MSQYKVAKMLYQAEQDEDGALSKDEIAKELGVQSATVGDTLRKLRRKDIAKRVGTNQYTLHPDLDDPEKTLDQLEPMVLTLNLSDDNSDDSA